MSGSTDETNGKIEELAGKTKDVIDKVVGKLTRNR